MTDIHIPTIDLNQDRIHSVIEKLYQIENGSCKDYRHKDFTLEDGQVWSSWTMRESVYKKKQDSMPTMARGIFSNYVDGEYFIKVRGYDKFFNVLETNATQVSLRTLFFMNILTPLY